MAFNRIHLTGCFLVIMLVGLVIRAQHASEAGFSFIAVDKKEHVFADLTKEDLVLTLNGKPVSNFSIEKKTTPTAYVLAVDNSGSLRPVVKPLMSAVGSMYRVNPDKNITLLLRFAGRDTIEYAEKFSSNLDYLDSKLNLFSVQGGNTALLDAIHLSARLISQQKFEAGYKKAIVVFSDGEERDSVADFGSVKKILLQEKIQLFFVGVDTGDDSAYIGGNQFANRKKEFTDLVNATGGYAVFARGSDIATPAMVIRNILNSHYSLKITDKVAPGELKVQLELKDKKRRGKTVVSFPDLVKLENYDAKQK